MIAGTNLTIEIGDRTLLRGSSFVVGARDKVGLVGRNGAGKSSLLSVVVGDPGPQVRSTGSLQVQGVLGFLPQAPVPGGLGAEPNGFSHVLSGRGLDLLDVALGTARADMAVDPNDKSILRYSELEEEFGNKGGYEAEATMARIADGLGLRQELLMEDIDRLSGGQRRRVDLVRLLFQRPEVMILDEPTNHLDISAKRWLMEELSRYSGTLLLVSHDLILLDRSISKVFHLADATLTEYKGTYSTYVDQREADQSQRERAATLEHREITRLSSLADSMRGSTVRRARVAKSLDRRVARLQSNRTAVQRRERSSSFRLPVPPRSGDTALSVDRLVVTYGDNTVLREVTFAAGRGERIVVVGRNGAGKSSLLRCLAGVQRASSGEVGLGKNVAIGYFAQEHEQIDQAKTALQNIDETALATDAQRRALLGSFGLPSKAADQLPGTLSGGERAKLGLAMLAAGRANLLMLDEPTNNLDASSIAAVGRMLGGWPGTVVAVSHDRSFVEALDPTHCLHLPAERYTHWREEYLDHVEMR